MVDRNGGMVEIKAGCSVCQQELSLAVVKSGRVWCLACLAERCPQDARLLASYLGEFRGLVALPGPRQLLRLALLGAATATGGLLASFLLGFALGAR